MTLSSYIKLLWKDTNSPSNPAGSGDPYLNAATLNDKEQQFKDIVDAIIALQNSVDGLDTTITNYFNIPMPATGYYLLTTSPAATNTSNTFGNGTLRVLPWVVTKPITITKIGAEVSVIGDVGSKLRLGIYADNGNSYPGALVLDAGQIAGDSATPQELATSTTLQSGVYWIGGAVQSVTTTQPTIRSNSNWVPEVNTAISSNLPTANVILIGYSMSGVTGALPANFNTTLSAVGIAPRVFVKI